MNYLMDTNIFIFLIDGLHYRLSIAQSRILSDTENEIFVSESSLFEIGIKIRLQKSSFSYLDISTIDAERKRLNIKAQDCALPLYSRSS
jgi:PIN domain nuclease of toxin-antitoxin system